MDNKYDQEANGSKLEVVNDLLIDMVKNQNDTIKRIHHMFITTVICYTMLLASMVGGFFWYESQFEVTSTVTTTTEQEVSGTDSEINNITGDMYKDDSSNNSTK